MQPGRKLGLRPNSLYYARLWKLHATLADPSRTHVQAYLQFLGGTVLTKKVEPTGSTDQHVHPAPWKDQNAPAVRHHI